MLVMCCNQPAGVDCPAFTLPARSTGGVCRIRRTGPQVRVLIADDHPLFRQGLRALLEARGFDVVGEAQTSVQAIELSRSLRPDVVLMTWPCPSCTVWPPRAC